MSTDPETCSVCRRILSMESQGFEPLCNSCWSLKQSLHHASLLALDTRAEVRDGVILMLGHAIAGRAP